MSEDPIGFEGGGRNLCRYVDNAPTRAADPTGLVADPSEPEKTTLADLADRLSQIAESREAKLEAKRIGEAIKSTFNKNGVSGWLWAPRAAAGNLLGRALGLGHGEERCRGYFCYEWAYAFEDAFNLVKPEYFDVKVWVASTPSGRVHYWIEIISRETGKSVYADDGFANALGSCVHTVPPIPGGYVNAAETNREIDGRSMRLSIPKAYGPDKPKRPHPVGPGPYIGPFNPY